MNNLEKELGYANFTKIFKTITLDNGSEFAGSLEFERSILEKGKQRTKTYFCHPYSSYERGSNENCNKLIRRHLPKGTSFKILTIELVEKIEKWINNYPRGIFKGLSSNIKFKKELKKLNINW